MINYVVNVPDLEKEDQRSILHKSKVLNQIQPVYLMNQLNLIGGSNRNKPILFCVWLVFKKIILLISFSGATKTADIHHMEDKVHEVQCVLTKKVGVAVNIRIHTSIIINTVS